MLTSKEKVKAFWNEASCGEKLYLEGLSLDGFRKQAANRYDLEPYINSFADFDTTRGKKVLEIGVGLGADHQRFAEAGALLTGIDLTPRAIEMTRQRFHMFGLKSELQVGDAENLNFPDNSFDLIYSWGVIHHSPDTQKAINEIHRILKPGGKAKIMIYNKYSLVGFMLWLRYALLAGKPFMSLDAIYASQLESPDTKAYSESEAKFLFKQFVKLSVKIELTHGDLLTSRAGQRHEGALLNMARLLWPRWLLKKVCRRHGLFMLIHATKPQD
jgi:ubiquinone/menaquinone biosynthesis C-methylase UbiE